MSNAFVSSPAKVFKQSLGRQRVTRERGKFIFQFLECVVAAHNTDGTPWGAFPNQDANAKWPNAMDAGPFNPAPVPGFGANNAFWSAHIHPFPQANDPFLANDGGLSYSPGTKLVGDFGWQTGSDLSGPIIWKKLIAYRQKSIYLAFTSPGGQSFPGGSFNETAFRFKIFPPVSGTATWHSMPSGPPIPPASPITIPLWKRQQYLDTGHAVQEFFPDAPVNSVIDFSGAVPVETPGTLELALFWFERKPNQLPPFPYLMDPSAAVV